MAAGDERSAGYRLAADSATAALPHVVNVLGRRFAASEAGRALVLHHGPWYRICDAALQRLLEFVTPERQIQAYRAPLRVGRQIVAAAYELHAAALLGDVVRRLELDVPARGSRRADLRATFLSQVFHVEVKTHEPSSARRGGWPAAESLARAARAQVSTRTPNLLVLGRVEPAAVARLARAAPPGDVFGAVAWLDLQARRRVWRGALYRVGGAAEPFRPALLDLLEALFRGSSAALQRCL